jgi:hypothetical protein
MQQNAIIVNTGWFLVPPGTVCLIFLVSVQQAGVQNPFLGKGAS